MERIKSKKLRRFIGVLVATLMVFSSLPGHAAGADELDLTVLNTMPNQPEVLDASEGVAASASYQGIQALRGVERRIYTPQDMAAFFRGTHANYDTFVVMNDIDMTGVMPINPGRPGMFTGVLRGYVGDDGVRPVVSGITLTHVGGPVVPPGEISRRLNTGIVQTAGGQAVIEDLVFQDVILTEVAGVLTYPIGIGSLIGAVSLGGNVQVNNVDMLEAQLSIGHTLPTPNHANTRLGGLVGMVHETARLTLTDIHVDGILTTVFGPVATLNIAGGVVGENRGRLEITASETEVEGVFNENIVNVPIRRTGNTAIFSHAGGVLGRVFTTPQTPTGSVSTVIEHTVVTSTDIIGGNRVGGFIGETAAMGMATIRDSKVVPAIDPPLIPVGTISSTLRESDVGGFIGRTMTTAGVGVGIIIERVENHADVIGAANPALGVTATAQGMREVGGIIGRNMAPTFITEAVNYGDIRHAVMRPQANAAGRTGGIVGRSSAPLHITDSTNHGNMVRNAAVQTAGSATAGHSSGGIVAWIEHSGTNVANQVARLTNVTNYGDVVGTTRGAGGIIGRVTHGANAASVTHVTHAVNRGLVRGSLEVGGIIGGVRTASDVRVDGRTRNYGRIWPTHQAHVGGVIGFINGPRAHVQQTGNAGRVSQFGNSTTGRGTGGIIGENRSNGLVMREVFNEGTITSQRSARTGGIIGWQAAAGLTIVEDFFVTGVVRTDVIDVRNAGSGVIGSRTTGQMIVRRGYVATRANGFMVAQDARRDDGRVIRNTMFNQVYVVNTIGIPSPDPRPRFGGTAARRNEGQPVNVRNRLHILQPGINVIGADLLATGLIPGVNHTLTGPWRVGVYGEGGYQSTLPYLAWQTSHTASGLQERFFLDKGDYRHHLYALAGATFGHIDFEYRNITFGVPEDLNYPIVRHYDPRGWGWEGFPINNAMGQEANRPIIPLEEPSGYVRAHIKPTGRITSGLISPNHVVAFGEAADGDLFVVQAIDMDCPFQSPIDHATMIAGPGVTVMFPDPEADPPVLNAGIMLTRHEMIELPWWVSAEALGYELMIPPSVTSDGPEPGRLYLTEEDVANGFINIPMRRVAIDRDIYVFVRDGSHDIGEDVDDVQPNLWVAGTHRGLVTSQEQANTTVFHHTQRVRNAVEQWEWDDVQERVVRLQGDLVEPPALHVHPTGVGQGHPDDPRPVVGVRGLLPRNTVTIGDAMAAGSAGYDWFRDGFTIGMIDDINATGPLTITVELDNITLPPNTPVRLVEIQENEEGEEVEVLIPTQYNPRIDVRHPDNVNPPLTPLSWTGTNPFALTGATLLSEILAEADGFFPVGWEVIEEFYNEFIPAEDGEPAVPANVTIVMERGVLVEYDEVRVVEATRWGSRLIANSTLVAGGQTLESATGVFENITVRAGEELVASAYRFVSNSHIACETDDAILYIYLTREALDAGTIAGYVWDATDRVTPLEGATVVLLSATGETLATTTSAADGFYQFTGLDAGTYRVLASKEGFRTALSVVDPIILGTEAGVWADVYLSRVTGPGYEEYLLIIDVVDPAGARVEAAQVTFNNVPVERQVTWDVELPRATGGYIHAIAEGFRIGAAYADAANFVNGFQTVVIELEPLILEPGMGGIHGVVTRAADGTPIEGAFVAVQNAAGEIVEYRLTDEFGRYEVLNIAPGTYTVVADASGFARANRTGVVVVANQMTVVNFALVACTDNVGDYLLVATVTGGPATSVVALGTPPVTLSDAEGTGIWTVRTNAPLTGRTVEASAPGFATDSAQVGAYTDGVAFVELHLDGDLPPRGGGIRGVVNEIVGGELVPVPNAAITITDATGAPVATAITDAQGRYSVDQLAIGPHTVHVSHLAFYSQYRNVTTINEVWVTANFTLVRRAAGPYNYLLEAFVLGGVADEVYILADGRALTNTGGNRWELGSDTPLTGETAVARAANHRPGSAVVGAHNAAGIATVTITIVPFAATDQGIYGTVRGPAGPLAGASITIENAAGAVVGNAVTNSLGHYEVLDLPVGSYNVIVVMPGFETQSRTVAVTANNMTQANFTLVPETVPTAYRLLVNVTGPDPANVTVSIDRPVNLVRVGTTNTWEARSNTPLTGGTVTAAAEGFVTGNAVVGAHDANGVARVNIHLLVDPGPGEYPLLVRNAPVTVITTNQTPVSGNFLAGALLGPWNEGVPAEVTGGYTWYFLGWATTTEGLQVGMVPPPAIIDENPPATMPEGGLTRYALWGDRDDRWGQPQPPDPDDIVIDVDEDGNVDINLDEDEYDLYWDDDGNITITIPDRDPDDVEVNLPGDDWDYDITVDGDGNVVVEITPPDRLLTVSNFPTWVVVTGQGPQTGLRPVGSVLEWIPGTPPEGLFFRGWASTTANLTVGATVPDTALITPPERMPGVNTTVFAIWVDEDGRIPPQPPVPCCDNPDICPGDDCDVCFNCGPEVPCDDCGKCPDCCDCPDPPPPPPPTRELIVNNSPVAVVPVNQSPVTNLAVEVGTPLTWSAGTTPLPADCGGSWYFIKWATTTEGLVVGYEPPPEIAKNLAYYAYKPDSDTVAYALWGDRYGRYGQPQPADRDEIVIDVDDDGNVEVYPPDTDYDLDWDDDGNITIVIPDTDPDDVVVNLPGDDWDYDITVDDGNVIVEITPPDRVLTVANFPEWVVTANQTPVTGPRPVGSVLAWAEGLPTPAELEFAGWVASTEGLAVGYPVPTEALITPPARMPGTNTAVYAVWTIDGVIPPPPPPPGDEIVIDVDDDGNVEIYPPDRDYDLDWDDDGNITIIIPDGEDDDVVVNLPGDDWDYDITVDDDGNVIVEITPPDRMLTVANFPSWVVTAGQTPVTGLRPVGSVLAWNPGTPVSIAPLQAGPPAPIAELEFAGWVRSTENLAVGYPVPAEELVTPPGRMPGVNSGFYAVWTKDGVIPPPPCCDDPDICPGDDCDVCFNCGPEVPCDDCGKCPDCCDCPVPPPTCCDDPDICPGDDCDVCFNCGDEVPCDDCGKCPDCCDCDDRCCDDPNLCPGCNECMTCGDLTECDDCGYCDKCCKCDDRCCDDPNLCPGCDECMTCGDLTECDDCGYCDKCCKCDDRCCADPRPCPDCGECMGCGPYGKCTGCGRCTDCCRCTAPPKPPQPPRPPTRDPERRPVPKTGDDANMALWMTLFGFGLFGLAATTTTLVKAKKKEEDIPTFVVTGDDGKER